jgi:hypothetical protein
MYAVLLDMVTRSLHAEQTPSFRPGTVLRATVEGAPGSLSAVSGPLRVPLPESAAFQPRQPVLIEVRDTSNGLQLLVRPAEAPAPQPPPASKPDLTALIQIVADALASAGVTADPQTAAEALPPSLPRTQSAVQEFLATFSPAALIGDDWRGLADLVARAVAAGAIPKRLAGLIKNAFPSFNASSPAEIETALARAAGDGVPLEAKLAAALTSEDPATIQNIARQDPRALIETLRNNDSFQSFLRQAGQIKTFDSLADKILARLADPAVQNIRSLDLPYMFLQIPCPPDGPFRRGHIHITSGGGGSREINLRSATIALDISTARLGDLWITISLLENHCACRGSDAPGRK